jgi:hypothetical protein
MWGAQLEIGAVATPYQRVNTAIDYDTADYAQASKTLLKGDLLGLGTGPTQQVVPIAADATANAAGQITVQLSTPLRNAFPAGTPVVWDKPKALFRQRQNSTGIEYVPGIIGQPWALDLIEDWRP